MDDQEQARQKLKEIFARDREVRDAQLAEARAREASEPRILRFIPDGLIMRLMILLVIIVIAGVPIFVVVSSVVDHGRAVDTVRQFCTAEGEGTYDAAYQVMSARVHQELSLADFQSLSQQAQLVDCGVTINAVRVTIVDNQATPPVIYHFQSGDDQGSMTLVREGGDWKIDRVDTSAFSSI